MDDPDKIRALIARLHSEREYLRTRGLDCPALYDAVEVLLHQLMLK